MPTCRTLSGGERRRVAVCKILLERPDLLLLDEPTNHLDAESVAWLERHLAEYTGTVVAVTHDRYFLDNVAGWILELDRGPRHSLGRQLLVVAGAKERSAGARRRRRPRPGKRPWTASWNGFAWPQGPAGQEQGPHQGLRANVGRGVSRTGKRSSKSRSRPASIWASWSSSANTSVKGYGDRLLIDDLSLRLPPGGIVGVIGPNGAGKTTLFRLIIGAGKARHGDVRVGADGRIGLRRPEPRLRSTRKNTIFEEISGGHDMFDMGGRKMNGPGVRGAVQFPGVRPAKAGRQRSRAASATGSTWPSCCGAAATCCSWTNRPCRGPVDRHQTI